MSFSARKEIRANVDREIGEDSRRRDLQRRGLVRIGAATLPASFWEHERPEDPEGTVRAALEAERQGGVMTAVKDWSEMMAISASLLELAYAANT